MDSLTQIALGSAVSEAVMANRIGRKASLWGAVLGTLPDLDVLVPLGDAVSDFTYHRGASHALFFMALAAPLILWLIFKIHPETKKYKTRWIILIISTFFTHALLDSFTVYGTQMYLPFSNYPVGWSTIFVIDPLYTLPLLIGVAMFFILRTKPKIAYKLNIVGLIISSFYLIWSVGVKSYVNSKAISSLQSQSIEANLILSGPSPFNTFLWRILAMKEEGYVEGFYSLFDNDDEIKFRHYESNPALLTSISHSWAVKRLKWFTKGFYKVHEERGEIIISDLRMGVEPLYFFRFSVGKREGTNIVEGEVKKKEMHGFNMTNSLGKVWERIWNDESGVILKD